MPVFLASSLFSPKAMGRRFVDKSSSSLSAFEAWLSCKSTDFELVPSSLKCLIAHDCLSRLNELVFHLNTSAGKLLASLRPVPSR